MPLLGKAAVAMWWDMAAANRNEFEDWHSHEHFPERLGIPGFERGSRWACANGGDGFFVMYELQAYETLTSAAYFSRLNDPTPWSVQMMPKHRNMIRSQCQVMASHGGGIAGVMLTIRLSPAPARADALSKHLGQLLRALPQRPGVTATHLLQTQTPQVASATAEEKIRGGADGVADWIVLATGYDGQVLQDLCTNELGAQALADAGALPAQKAVLFKLSHTLTPKDL